MGAKDNERRQIPLSGSCAGIPCRYASRPRGSRRLRCPFSHTDRSGKGKEALRDDGASLEDKVRASFETFESIRIEEQILISNQQGQDIGDDHTQKLFGATVTFDEFGHVERVSLPTDFSMTLITGLPTSNTTEAVKELLKEITSRSLSRVFKFPWIDKLTPALQL